MVHAFYANIRRDAVLGPIFNRHIDDWDQHLALLVDFWSSVLRGTGRFAGTPMAKHATIPDLQPELFRRWLAMFEDITSVQRNQAMGARAQAVAQRIAQSLWYGYQMHHQPDVIPKPLSLEPAHRHTTPVENQASQENPGDTQTGSRDPSRRASA